MGRRQMEMEGEGRWTLSNHRYGRLPGHSIAFEPSAMVQRCSQSYATFISSNAKRKMSDVMTSLLLPHHPRN